MNIEQLDPNTIKYHTCKFRSEYETKRLIKRCGCQGGDYEASGYVCEERQIFQVNPEICKDCPVYQSK